MSNIANQSEAFEKALIQGDLSRLTEPERLSFYKKICESLGLNPLTKPFEYIQLNGKLTLYATKACTEQLRSIHKVSLNITARDKFNDVYVVTARARTPDGREDEATGAVNIAGLRGDALANAFMKSETKSKRRVTLSICGLGMLDESEVETIPNAVVGEKNMTLLKQAEANKKAGIVYKIPFGNYESLTLPQLEAEIGLNGIKSYVEHINAKAKQQKKQITGDVARFILEAETYLIERQFKLGPPQKPKTEPLAMTEEEAEPYDAESYFQQVASSELDEALAEPQPFPEDERMMFVTDSTEKLVPDTYQNKGDASKSDPKPIKKAARYDAVKNLMKQCAAENVSISELTTFLTSLDENLTSLSEEGLLAANQFLEKKYQK